jgi:putative alpha-1,2-mannosidase
VVCQCEENILLTPPKLCFGSYFWSTWRLPAGASVSESGVWAGDTWTVGGTHGTGIKGVECKFRFVVTNLHHLQSSVGGYISLASASNASWTVEVVTGLSLIDVATARRNALAEIGSSSFDTVHARTVDAWTSVLQRVGASIPSTYASEWTKRSRMLYTAL